MRYVLRTAFATVAALALAGSVFAAPPKPTPKAQTPAAKPAALLQASGDIVKFDAATKTLTLKTLKGEESFMLSDKTTLHEGTKTLTLDEFGKMTGHMAKVHYSESGGQTTVQSVMVSRHTEKAPAPTPKH